MDWYLYPNADHKIADPEISLDDLQLLLWLQINNSWVLGAIAVFAGLWLASKLACRLVTCVCDTLKFMALVTLFASVAWQFMPDVGDALLSETETLAPVNFTKVFEVGDDLSALFRQKK